MGQPNHQKEVTLQFKINRSKFLVISVLLILILLGLYLYSAGFIQSWLSIYRRANAVLEVKNIENSEPIASADIKIDGLITSTDKDGLVVVDNLRAGNNQLIVTKEGFENYQSTLSLLRGDNKLPSILLKPLPAKKIVFSGQVVDLVTQEALADTKLDLDKESVNTSSDGTFDFGEVVTGKYQLKVQLPGFKEYQTEINIQEATTDKKIELTPEKTVYFLSNRDGKKGIYGADLDGRNQTRVVPKSDQGEETYLLISPNYQFAYFTSYRDGKKDESGNKQTQGYLLDLTTKEFKKINEDTNPVNVAWRDDSQYLIYESSFKEGNKWSTALNSYNVSSGQTKTLWKGYGSVSGNFVSQNSILVIASRYHGEAESTPNGTLLMKLDGSETKQIILDIAYGLREDNLRQKIYFQVSRDNLKYEFDSDKLEIKEIKEFPDDIQTYGFSPDGKEMIYSETRDGKTDIYLKPTKGGEEKRLTSSGTASLPTWLDNKYILYLESKVGETALYITANNGQSSQKVVDITVSTRNYEEGMGY